MLCINLSGFESPGMLRAVLSALRAYVDVATEEYIVSRGLPPSPEVNGGNIGPGTGNIPPDPEPSAAASTEVLPTEKPRRKRAPAAEVVQEPPPVDNAHVAEGCEQFAAPEVKIEDIRAVAKLFNTDELREVALSILRKHDAASVTALAERDNSIRVSALAEFKAAVAAHNLA
jgi:hypothetical protein